ncbi:hypothetical protein [Meiothermus sp.]|jgi:hypothetical protein|uniref:hypothetical protein n=1 Tax=Meiothermus sp. TaxID=1955249 RepID=UPI00263210C2|nr:hypothetical protein [Meiothermus sp.]
MKLPLLELGNGFVGKLVPLPHPGIGLDLFVSKLGLELGKPALKLNFPLKHLQTARASCVARSPAEVVTAAAKVSA